MLGSEKQPHLQEHLHCEDDGEDVVENVEYLPLGGPGRDVGPLHGKRDAVGGDEDENDEVEPVLVGEVLALHPEPAQNRRRSFTEGESEGGSGCGGKKAGERERGEESERKKEYSV